MELTFVARFIKHLLSMRITLYSTLIPTTPQQSFATRPMLRPLPPRNGHLDPKEVQHTSIRFPKHRAHVKQNMVGRTILPIVHQRNLNCSLCSDSLPDLGNGSTIRLGALK
jgi:hypothetical protein